MFSSAVDSLLDLTIAPGFSRVGWSARRALGQLEPVQVDLTGRNCVVTGANSGIGLETASQLAALGANVFYEFVPSLCNVADLPSRDDFKLLEEQGGRRTAMLFPPASDWTGPLDLWYKRLRDPPQ